MADPQTTSPQDSADAPVSASEQAARAQGHTEGGGAWPSELLLDRAVEAHSPADVAGLYEQQAQETKDAAKRK